MIYFNLFLKIFCKIIEKLKQYFISYITSNNKYISFNNIHLKYIHKSKPNH